METLTITDAAAKQIKHIMSSDDAYAGMMMRITVSGGGCSGFQYGFSLDDQVLEDDQVFEKAGIKIVSDVASLELLGASEIDYVADLAGASFVIKNPNAASSCGCGNSFSV